jgi:hypothetical protein
VSQALSSSTAMVSWSTRLVGLWIQIWRQPQWSLQWTRLSLG